MTSRDRVFKQLAGGEVDRVAIMGGWFHGVDNLAALAGLSVEDYLADPPGNLVRANRALGVDCMIQALVPTAAGQIRGGHTTDAKFAHVEPEALKADGEGAPDTAAEVEAAYDAAGAEARMRAYFDEWTARLGDIVLIPNFWDGVPEFHLWGVYGYTAYFSAIALYPEAVGRLYWKMGIEARLHNAIAARLIREYGLPPMVFTGCDLCNNAGPMISREFLRKEYFPNERHALEPFFDAGMRVVRHCDGNVMPLIDDFIAVGYSGFQGFQYECGVDPFVIRERLVAAGHSPLFFAGLNVTRTLPFGTVDDVRDEIDYVLDFTNGGEGLFFFTSSSIGPEVPLENTRFAYEYVRNGRYADRRGGTRRPWPWTAKHRE